MSSLKECIDRLESDFRAIPSRISVHHDLPFAILRYDPSDEWELRREVKLLATRLETTGRNAHIIRMSDFLWQAISNTEGLDEVSALEQTRGYVKAQEQVTTYLSDRDWCPLANMLSERLSALDPNNSIAFLTRVAAMAPGVYHMSALLDQMQGRSRVTTVLFYPGSLEGTTLLRFMNQRERDALGNYRVKIYG